MFESLDDAGRADRRDDLPDLPGPPPARGLQRDRARADRHLDPVPPHDRRAARSSSTPTCTRAGRPAAAASWGCRGSATSTPGCVGAYLVEHDLFDFLLFSLPDNDAWSHKNGPHAQVTSIAAADRQLERLMHAAGGPDAFLDQHAVIVTSDHSQAAVEERIRLDLAFADFDGRHPRRVERRRRGRAQPGAARGDDLRARPGPPRRAREQQRWRRSPSSTGSTSCCGWPGPERARGRGALARPASCGSRPAASSRTSGAARWSVEGELAALGLRVDDGTRDQRGVPRRARPQLVGAHLRDRRRRAAVGRPGLRVRRLGRRRPRRRRQPRLAAPVRFARRADVVRHRRRGFDSAAARDQWSLLDVAPIVRQHFGLQSRVED